MSGTAVRAAKAAGKILSKNFQHLSRVEYKDRGNVLTNADLEAEKAILDIISGEFPDHGIVAEESGEHASKSDYTWFIDPLDGTTNYSRSIPFFCTSIGLAFKQEFILGVIYNPILDEMFFAEKGKAVLNNKPITVSKTGRLEDAFLGFCHGYKREDTADAIKVFDKIRPIVIEYKKLGSMALELAYTACGRIDGVTSNGTNSWDWAGGILLVKEAGGKVTDLKGREMKPDSQGIIASNSLLHSQLLKYF